MSHQCFLDFIVLKRWYFDQLTTGNNCGKYIAYLLCDENKVGIWGRFLYDFE
jgi:hypothetical protein